MIVKGENMEEKQIYDIKNYFKYLLPVALFFVLSVFVFGPYLIYLSNSEELFFSLGDLLVNTLPLALTVFAVICVAFLLIPKKFKKRYISALFAIAVILYFQGNYGSLFFNAGVLDGTTINWNKYKAHIIINIIACIIVFIAVMVLTLKNKKSLSLFVYASLFLLAIQLPGVIIQGLNYSPKEDNTLTISKNNEFELSNDENIIFIILDAMDEAFFENYLNSNDNVKNNFDGFVQYDNALAAGARTIVALPIYYTGTPFLR